MHAANHATSGLRRAELKKLLQTNVNLGWYHCRIAGSPSFRDAEFAGPYNARRDNPEGLWKKQFGARGIMVANAFYETLWDNW
jgi:hypothetical protein